MKKMAARKQMPIRPADVSAAVIYNVNIRRVELGEICLSPHHLIILSIYGGKMGERIMPVFMGAALARVIIALRGESRSGWRCVADGKTRARGPSRSREPGLWRPLRITQSDRVSQDTLV